ncbi:uncharacterized protein LY79DRAFT_668677 [Colletotrichum navitas]|uniref:Uncharacterized protein n=1 Tax=Colletotrichum navitas TaxID=681940 RepID=A0AAD8Q394_9PEZI|nr:uncharacterized protein LY79DRAFT_668677 [Colletotrichum navitas]KAK1594401.1 hypothetical protein LY79DRAFT_668677 [Colletotrichum navitas]
MWHKGVAILSAAALTLLTRVDLVAATGGIVNVKHGTTLPVEPRILNLPAKPKRSIGSHLEPKTFPHDNPFNITEEEARKHGHKIIPVENDLWDELVESAGIDRDYHKNASLSKRAACGKNWDDDYDPPNPTDWCTPIRNTGECMLGLWVNRLVPHRGPNRGWVFDNTCEWIGENVPAAYYDWQEICSKLKYVTLFFINPDRWPHMAYAGHYYSSWDAGWEIYYPHGKEGTRHPPRYYYRRYFNCSAT